MQQMTRKEPAENAQLDVVALGELLVDFTAQAVDSWGFPVMAAHPGGAPANFLAAAAKFGASAAMVGKVGDDAFGRLLKSTLDKAEIDSCGVVLDPEVFTTLAFVTLDGHGERSFSFARKPGADTCLDFGEVDLTLLDRARVFHFGTLSLTQESARSATVQAVAYAKDHGALVTFDPNLRKPVWKNLEDARQAMRWGLGQADVVKISEEEVEFLFGLGPEEGVNAILEAFPVSLVFVTCGANGCCYGNANGAGSVPGLAGLRVVDTTGAGDIFGGSAVWKLLQLGKAPGALSAGQMREIAAFACASASLSTTKPGGISSVPEYEQILARMGEIG